MAQTSYQYDSKFNVTQTTQAVSGSTSLSTQYTYTANGNPATVTGPNGGVTTYGYGTNSCSGAFPDSVQGPVAALKSRETWDCIGGVPLTATDANNATSSLVYNDPLWRPTQVTDAAGNATNVSYSLAPQQVERVMTFNSGASANDALTTFDGLGRAILQRRVQPTSIRSRPISTPLTARSRRACRMLRSPGPSPARSSPRTGRR